MSWTEYLEWVAFYTIEKEAMDKAQFEAEAQRGLKR